MTSCSILICTYGTDKWLSLGEHARRSALGQGACEVIHRHVKRATLAGVRNGAAADAKGDYLIFLDGDDELESGYVAAMMANPASLRYPMVQYISADSGQESRPIALRQRPLLKGNFMVIGTLLSKEDFFKSGGFSEDLQAYEDYDLFIRIWLRGATPKLVPKAIYRAYVRPDSRNRSVKNPQALLRQISSSYTATAREMGRIR